jgi:multidrug resistance protein
MKTSSMPDSPKLGSSLYILYFIMIINALAYGTIIPLLYPYAHRFGIDPVGLSFLFASFSVAQFIATPLLGRLSDRWGRKYILLGCLLGTGISLAMFAGATTIWMLFVARIIDGITGGNISVAQAVVADTTKGEERTKAFGMLGATFGFGFFLGPALGGLMSKFGLAAPFWFAAGLAIIGAVIGFFVLPETLKKTSQREAGNEPLFRFDTLFTALFTPITGVILFIGLLSAIAQNAFVIGVQAFTVDILKMTPTVTGIMFSVIGIQNILMQSVGIRLLFKFIPSKKLMVVASLISSALTMAALAFQYQNLTFITVLLLYGISSTPLLTVLIGLLSERTKKEDQGGMLGINQSYTSIGQIIGPLLAGLAVAHFSIPAAFILSAGLYLAAFGATRLLFIKPKQPLDL